MMAADLLWFSVTSKLFLDGASPCYRACSARASVLPSNVQTSCLEHARPVVVALFAGALAASSIAPPGRRCPERQRRAKAEGKTKGGGTWPSAKSVCTCGWRGTSRRCHGAAWSAKPALMLIYPRALRDGTRHSFLETQP